MFTLLLNQIKDANFVASYNYNIQTELVCIAFAIDNLIEKIFIKYHNYAVSNANNLKNHL